jgi:hypothetical protein
LVFGGEAAYTVFSYIFIKYFEKRGSQPEAMFRRILVAAWVFIFGSVALLALFPKLVMWIPHPAAIRPFLILFVLVSLVYGVVWLYHQGMKRAKRKLLGGDSDNYDAPR